VRALDLQPVSDGRMLVCDRLRQALAKRLARLDRDLDQRLSTGSTAKANGLPGIHVDLYDQVAVVRFDGAGARAF